MTPWLAAAQPGAACRLLLLAHYTAKPAFLAAFALGCATRLMIPGVPQRSRLLHMSLAGLNENACVCRVCGAWLCSLLQACVTRSAAVSSHVVSMCHIELRR